MTNAELKQVAEELVGEEDLARRFRAWIINLIRVARMKRDNVNSGALYEQDIVAVLADLNARTGSRFGATDSAKALIRGRLGQGYQVVDFVRVHEVKCLKWLNDEKMEHNLRPSTLYRASHFDEYLGEWYAMDRARKELAVKRQRSQGLATGQSERQAMVKVQIAEREALVAQLSARGWDQFPTWAEFMRWTIKFPDANSLGEYTMPERIRKMRTAPGMLMQVLGGESPEWAETEYRELKREAEHGEN